MVAFTLPGKPIGKERPRMSFSSRRTYTPARTKNYEAQVRRSYEAAAQGFRFGDDEPLRVDVVAVYQIPTSATKKRRAAMIAGDIVPTTKPDLDNIAKAICDALNGVAYKDDSRVTEMTVRKIYGVFPETRVRIRSLKEIAHVEQHKGIHSSLSADC